MRFNLVISWKVYLSADTCRSGTSYSCVSSILEHCPKRDARRRLGEGGDATCRRIVMFGTDCFRGTCAEGRVSSLLSSSPKRDLFPKGPASVSLLFFLARLLLYGLLVWCDDGPARSAASVQLTHMACLLSLTLRSSSRNFHPSLSVPCVKFGQHFSDSHN
jgi:hypothetical protein